MKRNRHAAQAAVAAICLLAAAAAAQTYPAQAVRMVVAYGAGGGADTLIRAIAPELSEALGQPVVIENRPGAGTVIGTQVVASARPDGYTFLVADNAFYVNPFLVAKLPYDSARDFVPVVPLTGSSTTLGVVHPSLPARSVKELVALARARPGQLNYASGGNGTVPHLLGELMKNVTRTDIAHIPYKSTAAAIVAATSGEVPIAFGGVFACKGLIESGRLRALAIAAANRSPLVPSVPTFREAGFPEIDATSYRGLLAPAKTPRAAIVRLNADANRVLQLPAVRARLAELSYDVVGGTPEDYGRLIASEMEKWGRTIRSAGIKAQ